MERRNVDDLIREIKACVDRHYLGTPGAYTRFIASVKADGKINEYGVADAANLLYTINDFEQAQNDREHWIKILQGMQNPETGMYFEPTHHTIHTTAHCMAALELFDAKPLYKCTYLNDCLTKEGLYHKLETEIDFEEHPWRDSHIGAGVFVALTMTDAVDIQWKDWYFDWFWDNCSSVNGFAFFGKEMKAEPFRYVGGGFRYLFNHEAEHRPMRYPEAVIDYCLPMLKNPKAVGKNGLVNHCGFLEVDLVYSVTRAMRQTPHRFYEAKEALENFAEIFLDFTYSIDYQNNYHFNDIHCLFGTSCCLAELQSALPGKIITSKPLRLVLDRRPFI